MTFLVFGGEELEYDESHPAGAESLLAVHLTHAEAIRDAENRWANRHVDWYQVVSIDGQAWTTITEQNASEETKDRRQRPNYPKFESSWEMWQRGWINIQLYHIVNKRPWQEVVAVADGKAWMPKRWNEYTQELLVTFQGKSFHPDVIEASKVGAISLKNLQLISKLPIEHQPDLLDQAINLSLEQFEQLF